MDPALLEDPLASVPSKLDDLNLSHMPYPDFLPEGKHGRLTPYAAWSRCTRWVTIRQVEKVNGERVLGRWKARAARFVWHTNITPIDGMRLNPWDKSLHFWFRDRDDTDERVTRLPDNWNAILGLVGIYVEDSEFQAFCPRCNRNIAHGDLHLEHIGGKKGDQGRQVRCPTGHLLLSQVLIHID